MKKNYFSLLALTLLPSLSFADTGISNSFVEIGYTKSEYKTLETDGFSLNGSYAITDNIFVGAKYLSEKKDSINLDLSTTTFLFGYNFKHTTTSSLFVSYELSRVDWKDVVESFTRDINTLRFGLRNQLSEPFEISASVTLNDVEYYDFQAGFQLGAAYNLNKDLQLVVDYDRIAGDFKSTNLTLGLRLNFD